MDARKDDDFEKIFFLAHYLNGNIQIIDNCNSQDKVQCYKENKLGVRIVIPVTDVILEFSEKYKMDVAKYTNVEDGKRYKCVFLRDSNKFFFINETDGREYEINLTQLNLPIVLYTHQKDGKFIYIDFSPNFWDYKE